MSVAFRAFYFYRHPGGLCASYGARWIAMHRMIDGHQHGQVDHVVRELRAELERRRNHRARRAGWVRRFIPTGLTSLDAVLPCGGIPAGAITEIFSDGPGVGCMSLAIRIADRASKDHDRRLRIGTASKDHRTIVVVDSFGDFYPPAVSERGIPLERLIVIRTGSEKTAFEAVDQSLHCKAVSVVVASLRHLDERLSRRLQLAAKGSGGIGLILRSTGRATKSFAAVRMLVEGATDVAQKFSLTRDVHLCRISLLKVLEGRPAAPVLVDLHHETGDCPVHPVPVDRSATKSVALDERSRRDGWGVAVAG